ncbi:MAG: ArsR family transcriptional regulator [Chloroflexi bacterium]|jgi:hypothetical protein|nr:ArsR family transcriptional regulator [Chloroflexota bacterium]
MPAASRRPRPLPAVTAAAEDSDRSRSHPRHRLDAVIHAPVRFSIMATLAAADSAEFSFVRDTVEMSDSVLCKQVATLEQAATSR